MGHPGLGVKEQFSEHGESSGVLGRGSPKLPLSWPDGESPGAAVGGCEQRLSCNTRLWQRPRGQDPRTENPARGLASSMARWESWFKLLLAEA